MRHLEPRQIERREDQRAAPRRILPAILVAVALVVAGGYAGTRLFPPSDADVVATAEVKQREAAFATAPQIKLQAVAAPQVSAAINKMGLPDHDSQKLSTLVAAPAAAPAPVAGQPAQQPQQQQYSLVELVLWDTHAPDGDVVLVTSAGYSREVVLTKTPTIVYVPGSGAGVIQVTGIKDGGGGITLGVKGATQSVLMPIMSVGQTLPLNVQFQ
jgi:hypothetical protein